MEFFKALLAEEMKIIFIQEEKKPLFGFWCVFVFFFNYNIDIFCI